MCRLAAPNPRTYIGSGKVAEIKSAVHALDVETVIFDDELSAGSVASVTNLYLYIMFYFYMQFYCCILSTS